MGEKTYIGVDNGVSGSIGVISGGKIHFHRTPTKRQKKYTKKKAFVTRIDFLALKALFESYCLENCDNVVIYIERPMVNSKMFNSSSSALRAWEATLILMEILGIEYYTIDSKLWQRALLPEGTRGTPLLKQESKKMGIEVSPEHKELIEKQGDADGLLIAVYAQKNHEK